MRNIITTQCVACLLMLVGCRADPGLGKLDGAWGPGVADVEATRSKLIALIERARGDETGTFRSQMHGVYHTMTWRQAAYLYRTSNTDLRPLLLDPLILNSRDTKFAAGMTKRDIIALLGKPDDDWGDSIVYSGLDYVSDDTSGYLFNLDDHNRLTYVGCGP